MNKIFIMMLSLLIPMAVLAEASIKPDERSGSFLLEAPGTLSGFTEKRDLPDDTAPSRPAKKIQEPLRYKPGRYRKGGESYKFPQYGQVYGSRNNPWSEQEKNRRLPPPLPPASPYYGNPWDLSGKLPPRQGGYANPPHLYAAPPNQAFAPYGLNPNLYPDFPDGIYRDTNPASSMPFMNGAMPGMGGGDKYGLPFSPFGMF